MAFNVTCNITNVTCDGGGGMSGSTRTRKWREKRAAEGKKSFTVLLSIEAQQIINSEKEKSGDNYSEILERALRALDRPEYSKSGREQFPLPAAGNVKEEPSVNSQPGKINRTRILIDDFQNYEFNEDRVDFSYKKGADHLHSKENFLKRLAKFPAKKKWFR